MNSNFTKDFNKPSIFTAQQYGTKVSVEVERSDMDLDEVMDALQTLIIGLGYHQDAFKNWVIDRADEYREEDEEETEKDMGRVWTSPELEKEVKEYFTNLPKVNEEEENDFFGEWTDDDKDGYTTKCYCGHTGYCDCGPEDDTDDYNATLDQDQERYRASKEDEDEFDDYGQRIHPTFEWGDEPEEDDDNLFDGDEWEANENLKAANERYKKEVKKMKSKKRNTNS